MSTTDTMAAFEYWFSDEGAHPKAIERSSSGGYILAAASSAWNVWQAATEAAKATGTAGEQPALTGNDVIEMIVGHLISTVGGRNLMKGEEIGFSLDDLVFVANAAVARQPAPALTDEQIMEIAAPYLRIDITGMSEEWLMDCRAKFIETVRAILASTQKGT